MRKLFLFFFLFSSLLYGQLENLPEVGVGYGILKGTTVEVDSLVFKDNHTLLMQDNSTLIVRDRLVGIGIIDYGDVGDSIPDIFQVALPQVGVNVAGDTIAYFDYRDSTDVNPKIIFKKCVEDYSQMKFTEYIDVEYPSDCSTLNVESVAYENNLLKTYNCKVYNTVGQLIYTGKYGGMFINDVIDYKYKNKLLIIQYYINDRRKVKQIIFK